MRSENDKMAPGKGFEPLRAKGSLAGLSLAQALFVPLWDLEASAITTPPPRLVRDLHAELKEFLFQTKKKQLKGKPCLLSNHSFVVL
jgi:hypothetical protein